MSDASWNRLLARWSSRSPGSSEKPGTLAFERIDGERVFEARPVDAGDTPGDLSTEWVPFSFRHGHPATAPHAPDAPYLLVVHAVAPPDDREDFRRWLSEEHGARQTSIPGVHWLAAYESEGPDHSFLNLWGIDDPAIADGDEWARVRESPWWDRLAHVPAGADRGVYRRRDERSGLAEDVNPGQTGQER